MNGLVVDTLRVQRGAFTLELPKVEVVPGSVLGLTGRSGSGKSTFLEAVSGFLPLESGSVRVGGVDVTGLAPEKRRVALVFQRGALFPSMDLAENVAFGLRVQGVPAPERRSRGEAWLEKVGLAGLGARRVHALSEGQAQRVALARALIVGFPVLLLDEPFSALDTETRNQLYPLLASLVEETKVAAVLVSHQEEDLKALASRRLRLENGRAV